MMLPKDDLMPSDYDDDILEAQQRAEAHLLASRLNHFSCPCGCGPLSLQDVFTVHCGKCGFSAFQPVPFLQTMRPEGPIQ